MSVKTIFPTFGSPRDGPNTPRYADFRNMLEPAVEKINDERASAMAYLKLAVLKNREGDPSAAVKLIAIQEAIAPSIKVALAYKLIGQNDRARSVLETLDPSTWHDSWEHASFFYELGDLSSAYTLMQEACARAVVEEQFSSLIDIAHKQALLGDQEGATKTLASFPNFEMQNYFLVAHALLERGHADQAFNIVQIGSALFSEKCVAAQSITSQNDSFIAAQSSPDPVQMAVYYLSHDRKEKAATELEQIEAGMDVLEDTAKEKMRIKLAALRGDTETAYAVMSDWSPEKRLSRILRTCDLMGKAGLGIQALSLADKLVEDEKLSVYAKIIKGAARIGQLETIMVILSEMPTQDDQLLAEVVERLASHHYAEEAQQILNRIDDATVKQETASKMAVQGRNATPLQHQINELAVLYRMQDAVGLKSEAVLTSEKLFELLLSIEEDDKRCLALIEVAMHFVELPLKVGRSAVNDLAFSQAEQMMPAITSSEVREAFALAQCCFGQFEMALAQVNDDESCVRVAQRLAKRELYGPALGVIATLSNVGCKSTVQGSMQEGANHAIVACIEEGRHEEARLIASYIVLTDEAQLALTRLEDQAHLVQLLNSEDPKILSRIAPLTMARDSPRNVCHVLGRLRSFPKEFADAIFACESIDL